MAKAKKKTIKKATKKATKASKATKVKKAIKTTKAKKTTSASRLKAKSKSTQNLKKKVSAKAKTVATAKVKSSVLKKQSSKVSSVKSTPAAKTKSIDYGRIITPLADRLVVRVDQVEKMTPGGLIIPASVTDSQGYLKATVLAVGSGSTSKKGHRRPIDVTVGDTVLFPEFAGTKIKFNDEDLFIVNESDILGISTQ